MWNKFSQYISFRLAILLSIASVTVVFLNAILVFDRTYQAELNQSKHSMNQLIEVVSNTAAISVYVDDLVLAKEVIEGLVGSDLISAAEIKSSSHTLFEQGEFMPVATDVYKPIHYSLNSPFDNGEVIGLLIVQADYKLIEKFAHDAASDYVTLMTVHSAILILLVIFLVNSQLISGIKSIAAKLHEIVPGSEKRINATIFHKNDEIGTLASDINQLLDSIEITLNNERGLREEVERLERRFRSIFEQASGGIALIDPQGLLKVHNPSFEKMLGPKRMQRLLAAPKEPLYIVLDSGTAGVYGAMEQALLDDAPVSLDIQLNDPLQVRWIHCLIAQMQGDSQEPLLQIIMQDISERRSREQSFKLQAELDPLTGLFNRRAGSEKIQKILDEATITPNQGAFLMLDLDNFKPINDNYGHDAGDNVLILLTDRLRKAVRANDIIIRWGGDEFLLFMQCSKKEDAGELAAKLINIIQMPFTLEDTIKVHLGVSIGISVYPENGFNLDILVQRADEAMYTIKQETKGSFAFFTNS